MGTENNDVGHSDGAIKWRPLVFPVYVMHGRTLDLPSPHISIFAKFSPIITRAKHGANT